MNSRPSFSKRQKEQARKEKQRLKAERKQQRKSEKSSDTSEPLLETAASPAEQIQPEEGRNS